MVLSEFTPHVRSHPFLRQVVISTRIFGSDISKAPAPCGQSLRTGRCKLRPVSNFLCKLRPGYIIYIRKLRPGYIIYIRKLRPIIFVYFNIFAYLNICHCYVNYKINIFLPIFQTQDWQYNCIHIGMVKNIGFAVLFIIKSK